MTRRRIAEALRELLLSRIRDVPDHPQPGVMFKDITPLLADPAAFGALTEALAELCARHRADKVVGLEARGFILAAPVAVRAGRRLRPRPQGGQAARRDARRRRTSWSTAPPRSRSTPRTSPRATGSWSSTTCSPPAAPPRPRCSSSAAPGAEVAGVAVLLELGFLAGRQRLEPGLEGAPLEALITV